MGNFVAESERYTSLLQKKLSDEKRSVEILNFGVTGYNTVQEVETLKEKGLDFKPDLVILQYCHNDDSLNDSDRLRNLLKQFKDKQILPEHWSLSIFHRSALYRLIYFRFKQFWFEETSRDMVFRPNIEAAFSELKEYSVKYDFKVLVVVFPTRNMGSKGELMKQKSIMNLAQRFKFYSVDLLLSFKKCLNLNRVRVYR